MSNVSDLTIEVLKDIREELRSLRADMSSLRVDMNAGFANVNRRLDGVIEITGRHHSQLESRVARIEDHLGLPR